MSYQGLKVAVVCSISGTGEAGGAEYFYHALLQSLIDLGCKAKLVNVPADESTFDQILENYDYCKALDLSDFDLVISTKTPSYAISHPRHVLYLVHTTRVFYDMFDEAFPSAEKALRDQREQIQTLDTALLTGIKHRFSIGHEVTNRLLEFNGLDSQVLHPPLAEHNFREGKCGDYFFIPGRLHRWKRLDLLIEAVKSSKLRLKLLIAGTGEAEEDLRQLAGNDTRIEFLGRVSNEELPGLYANALAIPFVPVREDYGYITIEAFSSAKPVITCTDSGEPTQFVKNMQTGLVCEPTAIDICKAMEYLFKHRSEATEMGRRGKQSIEHMQWSTVAETLVDAALEGDPVSPAPQEHVKKPKVAVIDMQPIEPPVGGGRLRLLGLYHHLGGNYETRYVGSYDWEGESYRRHYLSDTLEEIDVPLSKEHHKAAQEMARKCGDKVVIDLAFPQQGHLSEDYLEEARRQIEWADTVIFSHPWLYPLLQDSIKPAQILIYDSHNVESFLRAQILDLENPTELALLKNIIETEYRLCEAADVVLACSDEDAEIFVRIYDMQAEKISVVPNGVFAQKTLPPSAEERSLARQRLGVSAEAGIAIFLGSNYGPNIDAARFIAQELAPKLSEVIFVVAGGVGAALEGIPVGDNVVVTGFLEEEDKGLWLRASTLAINPMFGGSGTNIKMFDFMAAGLPTVSTDIGARGIHSPGGNAMRIVSGDADSFIKEISSLADNESYYGACSQEARSCVEDGYAWESISPSLGRLVEKTKSDQLDGPKRFSVVIPTYERHEKLGELFECLKAQSFKNFEVIVVDQSEARWPGADRTYAFPLMYCHTPVKGAVRARNTGAQFAQGKIIAFTDDDCRPSADWLENCSKYFEDPATVAVEGLIYCDHENDPEYRPVTNVGFEGFGFMTANLFVRHSVFKIAGGGFDLQFDQPHFREDTDLGWRLMQFGKIPYAADVRVFHPAQPRANERESLVARASFFEKDALLYKKHPDMYRKLFFAEGHWSKDQGFWDNFTRGADKYNVDIGELNKYRPSAY